MNILFKYLISGGTSAVVDLLVLNFLDSYGIHHVFSVNIAFLLAFFVSFSLQRYWTFRDAKKAKTHHQLMIYFSISVINLFINYLLIKTLLYLDLIPLHIFLKPVVMAQIIASIIIAFESFVVYRYFIFKKDDLKKDKEVKPNILIVTQKVDTNDATFQFFIDWLNQFSKNCKKVTVIGLEVGEYKLPENVRVFSLKKGSKITSIFLLWKYSIIENKNYDVVFCHMSPIYVISGWAIWRFFGKKVTLWYVHRSVDLKLKIAHLLTDLVFTATPESFRIKSSKVRYLGQAVDLNKNFRPKDFLKDNDGVFKLITVGRITRIKNLDVLIRALVILKDKKIPFKLDIVGATVNESDEIYKKELESLIEEKSLGGEINFLGLILNNDLPKYHMESDVSINLSPTGGLDKTVLESMAVETPTLVANKAFVGHLGAYTEDLLAREGDEEDFANKLIKLYHEANYNTIGKALRKEIENRSSLNNLISSIVKNIYEIS